MYEEQHKGTEVGGVAQGAPEFNPKEEKEGREGDTDGGKEERVGW